MSEHEFDEGEVSAVRVALYAVAVLALIGALFYGATTPDKPRPVEVAKTDCR